MRAKFYQDADVFGKQDPFIQFKYNGKLIKTSVKAGAGKEATWNEEFTLVDIGKAVKAGEKLTLAAVDDNYTGDTTIGTAKPIDYKTIMKPPEFSQEIKKTVKNFHRYLISAKY